MTAPAAPAPSFTPPSSEQNRPASGRRLMAAGAALLTAGAVIGASVAVVLSRSDGTGSDVLTPPPVQASSAPSPDVRYGEEPPANWDVHGVGRGDVLNVRTGPGISFPVIARLPHDTVELESSGRTADVAGVLWREIKVPGATTGWVAARHLTEHRPPSARSDRGLPPAAEATAQRIAALAARDDLRGLAVLALQGEPGFTASFGEEVTTPDELVALWERSGRGEILHAVRALVALPDWYATSGSAPGGSPLAVHVTPRFMHDPSEQSRGELEARLGAEQVRASLADGQWLGWRLGVDANGDWRFLVHGD